jgi:hypothetical protein
MVSIFAVFEEGELLGLDRICGNRTSHYDKSMRSFPVMGFVSKFSHFPPPSKLFETTLPGSRFDRGIFLGHNRVATARRIEKFDDPFAKESRIGSNPNTRSGNELGGLGQTHFQKWNSPRTGSCISRTQRSMPKLLKMGFEAEERVIGPSAMLLGIVAYMSPLGFAIEDQNDGIQIENQ